VPDAPRTTLGPFLLRMALPFSEYQDFYSGSYTTIHKGGFVGVQIREKPKGSGIWWVFINHHGKRKSKKIGNDEGEAHKVAEKIKARLVLGELEVESINKKVPAFKPYAETWLALPHEWKESTRQTYEDNLTNHIYPVLGKWRLDEITRKMLKEFFDNLLIKGLSSRTVKLIKAPINGVLAHAVDSEIIEKNPTDGLKIGGKRNQFKVDPLTEDQAAELLEQAKIFLDGYYYPHFLSLLRTGIRLGELIALKWKVICYEKRQIEIKRSSRKGRITDTKNHKNRFVNMTPHLTETLKDWHTEQKRAALKAGKPLAVWIFGGKRGECLCPITLKNALKRCLDCARLHRIRIHDLRHSYATIRLLRGHNIGDVSYQLGHSSISMTYDIYTHWVPGKFKSEVDKLDFTNGTLQNTEKGAHRVQN